MKNTPKTKIPTIPVADWEKIVNESRNSKKILESEEFAFLRDYLHKAKESCINMVATNSIKDIVETNTDPKSGYSKSIKTSKEEQLNEIAGCIKFIDKIFVDLEAFSKQEKEYLKAANDKKVNIETTIEDEQRESDK